MRRSRWKRIGCGETDTQGNSHLRKKYFCLAHFKRPPLNVGVNVTLWSKLHEIVMCMVLLEVSLRVPWESEALRGKEFFPQKNMYIPGKMHIFSINA